MSALGKRAAEVEHELGAAWTRYHVGAQATRFLAGVVVSLVLSMGNGFSNWADILPLLGGAAWATARQMWPQVPWSLIRDRLHAGAPSVPAPKEPTPPSAAP
ncbi:MAG: hypothetical protein HOW97_32950 [Catenulispora sp.]|nr:hypothetical protein [Catenulispora sp.]